MKTIWKYEIPVKDYFELDLPKGAQVLTVQTQHNEPHIWCLVDSEAATDTVTRCFRLSGTGHRIEGENHEYINTFQILSGSLVFHLFEILSTEARGK